MALHPSAARSFWSICIIFTLVFFHSSNATDLWINGALGRSGDVLGCGTESQPCGTIKYAITQVGPGSHTLLLFSGQTYDNEWDHDIVVQDKSLLIQAATTSTQPTVIDCVGRSRFLHVKPIDTLHPLSLQIKGLVFQNCAARSSEDGATDEGKGGVILTTGIVDVNITDCIFSSNVAVSGSALYLQTMARQSENPPRLSQIFIVGSTFYNNSASIGGSLYSHYTTLTIQGSLFSHNRADSGAALFWLGSTSLLISDSTFQYNTAGFGGGSAVYASSASRLTIQDSSFHHNYGKGQGTVYLYFGPQGTFNNLNFFNNTAVYGGGGIAVSSQASATVFQSRFEKNNGGIRGGAIFVTTASRLVSRGVEALGNSAAFGAGFFVDMSVAEIASTNFKSNEAQEGGALYGANDAETTLTACTMENNHATINGAGIFCRHSWYTLNQVTFMNNTAGKKYTSSKDQNVYCSIVGSYDYCHLSGDKLWNGHCKLIYDKPVSFVPSWFKGLMAGLGVLIIVIVAVVGFWMYRVKKNYDNNAYQTVHEEPESLMDDAPNTIEPEDGDTHLWSVVTKPNQVQVHEVTDVLDAHDDNVSDEDLSLH